MLLITSDNERAVYQQADGFYLAVHALRSEVFPDLKQAFWFAGFTSDGKPIRFKEQPRFVQVYN